MRRDRQHQRLEKLLGDLLLGLHRGDGRRDAEELLEPLVGLARGEGVRHAFEHGRPEPRQLLGIARGLEHQ